MYDIVRDAVEERNFKKVKDIFSKMNEADIADLMQGFHDNREADARDITLMFRLLPKDTLAKIRSLGMVKETVYTIYVTSQDNKLLGVLSILDLLTAEDGETVGDIMDTNVITVETTENQEVVANKFAKYDFIALPVVDNENRIVGIVTFDDAMDVAEEEATEDFAHMAAVEPLEESYFKTSVIKHARNRIVWLLVLMLSSTISSIIIGHYEPAFVTVPLLVASIPTLTGTGGNCGSQTSTMVIRGMSLGEIELKDFFKVMFKEFRISLIVAVILAAVNFGRICIQYRSDPEVMKLALCVSLAIFAAVVMSKLIGCILPMAAKAVRIDPALMAAPFISTVVDASTTLVFFNIALPVFDIKL